MNEMFGKLAENELVLTNLPTVETSELQSEHSVKEFLVNKVHKDLQVKAVKFVDSLSTPNLRTRTAYIKVKVGSKRQA